MSLSDITKELFKIYNKKYDKNEEDERRIVEQMRLNQEEIIAEYKNLLLCCNKNESSSEKRPYDSDDEYDPVKLYEQDPAFKLDYTDECSLLCALNNLTQDKTFVKKMIMYRKAEIEKKLMFIKYNIEIYKYIITGILNLTYKKDAGIITSESIQQELAYLNSVKEQIEEHLNRYILDSEQYILNTTLCNYLFLKDRYQKLVKNENI
jgi:hypothetical protein